MKKLEIKDAASVETINETESPKCSEYDATKEKLSNLKNDAAETADCLASINSRIAEHISRMEKLKKLEV